jgi:CRISPR/Cas system CSM-associated protein Csm3 (group 7 of RAMP superfamily)
MYNLSIKIEFLDYWHCGSGESGGNESDSLVVKYDKGSKKGLPYVPAKTLKGLMRELAEVNTSVSCEDLYKWFGASTSEDNRCYAEHEETEKRETETHIGNANIVDDIEAKNISYLFKTFKNTKIQENGVTKDGTLREIETVVPLTLEAEFTDIDADPTKIGYLTNAIKSIKRIGLNRNRGMGRCEVNVVVKESKS